MQIRCANCVAHTMRHPLAHCADLLSTFPERVARPQGVAGRRASPTTTNTVLPALQNLVEQDAFIRRAWATAKNMATKSIYAAWNIWKERCRHLFDNKALTPSQLQQIIRDDVAHGTRRAAELQ
jgi:hypothetical protein